MLTDPDALNTGFNAEYLTPTTFTVTAHDIFHCTSSTVTFQYAHGATFNDTIRATICDGAAFNQYGFHESETGVYTHADLTAFGCDSITTLVLESYSADAAIEVGGTDLCEDGYVELTAVTSNANFRWSNGSTNQVLTVTRPGNYVLDASDGPCHARDMVVIAPCPDEEIYIPNAITPTNVDGINDYFQIYIPASLEIVEFEIAIYDRWGRLVFKSEEPDFRWNGKVNGKSLPSPTTLTYRIMMMSRWHPRKVYKGTLTVF
jgi:gliding motility-associated-like protein